MYSKVICCECNFKSTYINDDSLSWDETRITAIVGLTTTDKVAHFNNIGFIYYLLDLVKLKLDCGSLPYTADTLTLMFVDPTFEARL